MRFISLIIFLISVSLQTFLTAQPKIDLVLFADGFSSPVAMANAYDNRLFVVERSGVIKIVEPNGNVLSTPFLDIKSRVVSGGEQGLLGLAFHPQYATNGYFYVNYIGTGDSTHISRFSVSSGDDNLADPGSEFNLMTIYQPFKNHNGGDLKFGKDGYLYIGLGDGGDGGDPGDRAQSKMTHLGKILRIDVNSGFPYAIPPTNPFTGTATLRDEIWAYGLRNPWRFSFDRETSDLWIADVGQGNWEEINFQEASSPGGENYGWRCYEATAPYNTSGCGPSTDYVMPIHFYANGGGNCSVTGGYVYRGSAYPGMKGYYIYSDYCGNKIWTLKESGGTWSTITHGQYPGNGFSTFGEDNSGELYVAGVSSGKVFHIVDTSLSNGIAANDAQSGVMIFPNPISDELFISLRQGLSGVTMIKIVDVHGRVVRQIEMKEEDEKIDLNYLEAGIYFIQINSGTYNYSQRFVKH